MNIKYLFEWPEWESISHMALVLLYLYVFYIVISDVNVINLQNILMFMIVVALDTLIHQNINNRTKKYPQYFI